MQHRRSNARIGLSIIAGLGLLAVVGATVWFRARDEQPAEIRFAYQNHLGSAVCVVAVELNLFRQEGVAVAALPFPSGPACAEALCSGSADLGTMGDTAAIIATSRNGPYRILASHGAGEQRHRLMVAAQASIRSAGDLRGKTVAVKKGTSTYGGLLAWLAANDIRPAELRLLDLGPSEMPDALAAGSIDAFLASEPTPSMAETRGAREVATLGGLGNDYPLLVLGHTRLLQSRPSDVRAVLRALQRAVAFIQENPERAAQILAQSTGLPPPLVSRAMQRHGYRLVLDNSVRQSLQATAVFLREQQLVRELPDWEQVCDDRFLPREASGKRPFPSARLRQPGDHFENPVR